MEVEYELTPEDLAAFRRYHQKHPLVPQKHGLASIVVWVVFVLGVIAYFSSRTLLYSTLLYAPSLYQLVEMIPGVCLGALLALVSLALYTLLIQSNQNRKALQEGRNAEKTLGWRRLAIDPHAIRMTSAFSSSRFFWEGVDAVAATRDYAFIYITTRAAYIVSRRAFPDDRAFADFVETARRYHRISRLHEGKHAPVDEDGEWENPGPPAVAPPPGSARAVGEGIITKARPPEENKPSREGEQGRIP